MSESNIILALQSAEGVAELIASSSRILIATGAGISVSCGIPDFRSKDTGLYTSGRHIADGIPSAELFFDIDYFKIDPAPFYKMAKSLVEANAIPSKTHRFLCMLEQMGKIQNIYTQNIDGLERAAGCQRVVQGHGSMQTFHCLKCKRKDSLDSCKSFFVKGNSIPYCRYCRSGVMKPDIVFFGEACPASLYRKIEKDCNKCDLIIVMGTSLKVKGPVTHLLDSAPPGIPIILINNQLVSHISSGIIQDGRTIKKRKVECMERLPDSCPVPFSAVLLGACDDITKFICDTNNWISALERVKELRHTPTEKIMVTEEVEVKENSEPLLELRRSGRKPCAIRLPDMMYPETNGNNYEEECSSVSSAVKNENLVAPPSDENVQNEGCDDSLGLLIYFETHSEYTQVYQLTRGDNGGIIKETISK